jgi:hypothetical protein
MNVNPLSRCHGVIGVASGRWVRLRATEQKFAGEVMTLLTSCRHADHRYALRSETPQPLQRFILNNTAVSLT